MKRLESDRESLFFFIASALVAAAGLLILLLGRHIHLGKPREAYGLHHLPVALFSVACFLLVLGLVWRYLPSPLAPESKPTAWYLSIIVGLFCVFWLPLLLTGGFVQDDWMLLSAAAIRKIVWLHPALGWDALDSVDGNFRPLGTVLYPSLMMKLFGLHARAFLAANFVVNLGSALVVFFIVRSLRYSKVIASVAAILYLSRDVLYTENAWFSALGDALAILFCGLAVLATLRALRSGTGAAIVLHVLAFSSFFVATLAKQSAFAAAVIVPLIFLLRPGQDEEVPASRRWASAIVALAIYGSAALLVFEHAKALLGARTPYTLHVGIEGVEAFFEYLFWYFAALSIPNAGKLLTVMPIFAGIAVAILLALLVRRLRPVPARAKDLWFSLGAAAASLALVLPLAPRVAAYYSSMFTFWFSIVLALCLGASGLLDLPGRATAAGRRTAFALCVLVALGFADVRVMQTALIPSGGYIWGTYGMDMNASVYRQIASKLNAAPQTRTLVLDDFPGVVRTYACMALLADPALTRIVLYDSKEHVFLANDRDGARPANDVDSLKDPDSYLWSVPLSAAETSRLLADSSSELWLTMQGEQIESVAPTVAPTAANPPASH